MSTSRTGGRRIFYQIWKDFKDSFSLRNVDDKGKFVGEDLFGNKFYENPADPSRGKRLPRRSFEPLQDMRFDVDNMSVEWDAWLKHRRKEPPTVEELKSNKAIAEMKKINAQKLAEKEGRSIEENKKHSHMTDYPQYEEYESTPGKGFTKFDPK